MSFSERTNLNEKLKMSHTETTSLKEEVKKSEKKSILYTFLYISMSQVETIARGEARKGANWPRRKTLHAPRNGENFGTTRLLQDALSRHGRSAQVRRTKKSFKRLIRTFRTEEMPLIGNRPKGESTGVRGL